MKIDNVEWILGGDFNEVRNSIERQNTQFCARRASNFKNFIQSNGLVEIPLVGKRYTRISDDGTQFSKLDRFFVSNTLFSHWDCLSVILLDRKLSDHSPLLLKNGQIDFGPKPIRIFNSWLEEKGAEEIIINAWNDQIKGHRLDCIFRLKLKRVKERLKEWSKQSFGRINEELRELGLSNQV
ncbi:uncharacterized protein [Rutidosis leptorrhynchoides]|uniref:uncharacterized protein n=1 Tax=Rutidosis leptorrhynchoides TaxID=125765 RepID=UPI003A99644D